MNIAIVGAGFAGLATAWNFLQRGARVTVFDGGGGASFVSTGLLHPSPGRRALPIARAQEGMQESLHLLALASQGGAPVFVRNGILRIAVTEEQKEWFGGEQVWIPEGVTVYSKLYLAGLKRACSKAVWVNRWVENVSELQAFDAAILTTGAETRKLVDIPLSRSLGQSLLCRWKGPFSYSLLSYGHITPTEDPAFCQVGSTYEHTERPDPQKAMELLEKAALFYPPAREFEIVEVQSGVRVGPKVGYVPIVKQVDSKTWIFVGLGSRGLIYHALYAKELVDEVYERDIPVFGHRCVGGCAAHRM